MHEIRKSKIGKLISGGSVASMLLGSRLHSELRISSFVFRASSFEFRISSFAFLYFHPLRSRNPVMCAT